MLRSGLRVRLVGQSRALDEPAELADSLQVSRQTVSNHLSCLRGCGLVVAVPGGRRTRYELADARIAHALDDLLSLVLAIDPAVCAAASTRGCC